MSINGSSLKSGLIGGHALGQSVKFEFNEMLFRRIAGQVKDDTEKNGGALPMPDPAGFLVSVLIMDKLNAICERLDMLEKMLAAPADIGEPLLDPCDGIHGSDGT